MITLIAAVDLEWGIGKDGGIPWKLPEDMKHFRDLTSGNTVIMGRATYESIGKPLPNRKNIVMSSSPATRVPRKEGLVTASSVDEVLGMLDSLDNNFIIGGEAVYAAFLPHADKIELTFVNGKFDCDRVFPKTWENCALTGRNTSETFTSKSGLTYCFGSYELSHSTQHKGKDVSINTYWNFAAEELV